MKTIKIIDLLNKIANGEENIRVKHKIFELHYINMENMNVFYPENIKSFSLMTLIKSLNDEIEIIEEDKKIGKLEYWVEIPYTEEGEYLKKGLQEQAKFNENIYFKINEIIEKLNKEE